MGIMVNHFAKESVAVCCVLRRVEYVLMPELIKIVPAFLVGPRDQHEAGPFLQQG